MTICIAGIFRWNYSEIATPEWGPAAICLSDRMITAGDVKYEIHLQKVAHITPTTVALIAGDMTAHSQAIVQTRKQLKGNAGTSPHQVAQIYGQMLQQIRHREAEDRILAPLGLNMETFISQQKEMSKQTVDRLLTQLQDYEGEPTEAIVVGFDTATNYADLYEVDQRGTARCYTDIGFAAIGNGARLSSTQLMSLPYSNEWALARTLAALYSAKKLAEMSPNVGRSTDVSLITRDGVRAIWPNAVAKLDDLRQRYQVETEKLTSAALGELQAFFDDPKNTLQTVEAPTDKASDEAGADGEGNSGNSGCGA